MYTSYISSPTSPHSQEPSVIKIVSNAHILKGILRGSGYGFGRVALKYPKNNHKIRGGTWYRYSSALVSNMEGCGSLATHTGPRALCILSLSKLSSWDGFRTHL